MEIALLLYLHTHKIHRVMAGATIRHYPHAREVPLCNLALEANGMDIQEMESIWIGLPASRNYPHTKIPWRKSYDGY
jgi:hypothetical protein